MKKNKKIVCSLVVFLLIAFLKIPVIAIEIQNIASNNGYMENTQEIKENSKGEIIIMYENTNVLDEINVKSNFLFQEYTIEDTAEFNHIDVESDNIEDFEVFYDKESSAALNIALINSKKYNTQELIEIFSKKSWVISAMPNFEIEDTSLTDDTYESYQWAIENNGQYGGTEGKDINPVQTSSEDEKVIAIVDSGVDYNHEDLKNSMWVNTYQNEGLKGTYGYDFYDDDEDPMDEQGHGTHCAGIIAAQSNNQKGITGAVLGANNIKIMALKTKGIETGTGTLWGCIKAYQYIYNAQQLGVKVVAINNSWTVNVKEGTGESAVMLFQTIINLVGQNGALSICSAGNDGYEIDEEGCFIKENVKYKRVPSGIQSDYTVVVSASNENDELACFSNYGKNTDISAPGTTILSTVPVDKTGSYSPSLLTESQKNNDLKYYYNFDNDSDLQNLNYKLMENVGGTWINAQGTVSTSDEKFFGNNGKSLKWTFEWTEEDLQNKSDYFENLIINLGEYVTTPCTSISVHSVGPDGDTSSAVYIYNRTKDEEGEKLVYVTYREINRNLWTIGNKNWKNYVLTTEQGEEIKEYNFAKEIYIKVKPTTVGTYTIYIDDIMISNPLENIEDNLSISYGYKDGTSMATPYVTAAVGVISNLYDSNDALKKKDILLKSVRNTLQTSNSDTTKKIIDFSKIEENIPIKMATPIVSIDADGRVTWNTVTGATGYEISFDNSTWEIAESGSKAINTETTGEKAVYVRAISTNDKYDSPSQIGQTSVNVYSLVLNNGKGITNTSGAGNYVSGKIVNINAIIKNGYIWEKWVVKSGTTPESTTNNETILTVNSNTVLEAIAKVNGTIEIEEYEIENNMLKKVKVNTSTADFKTNIIVEGMIERKIVSKSGVELPETDIVKTGDKLQIIIGGEEITEYPIAVKGDSTGDGQANIGDILAINKHRLKKVSLTNEYFEAANVNEDNEVDIRDIFAINKFRLGKIDEL